MRYLGHIQSKHHKENILHQISSLLSRRTLELSAYWIWKFDKVSFPRNACCFLVRWIYLVMLFPRISLFLSSYLVWFDNLSPISNLIKNQWNKYTSNGHHHIGQSRWSFISEDGKIDTDPQTFEIEFQADKVNQADPANPSRAVIQFRAQLIQPGNCSSHTSLILKNTFFHWKFSHWRVHWMCSCGIDWMQSLLFYGKGKSHIQNCVFNQNWILDQTLSLIFSYHSSWTNSWCYNNQLYTSNL